MLELQCNDGNYFLYKDGLKIFLRDFAECKHSYLAEVSAKDNKCVFIFASGPSAKDFPVARYADYPFISMNGSITRLADENIRPLFYLCDDRGFPSGRPDLAMLGCNLARHIAMSLECFDEIYLNDSTLLVDKSLYLLERVNRYYKKRSVSDKYFAWSIRNDAELVGNFSLLRSKPNRIGFSKNMRRGHFCARTIVYVALQLTYTLGFQKVFIVGMDLNENAGRFYEDKENRLPTALDEQFNKLILPSFLFVSKKIIHDGFRVFNLSLNSRLPGTIIPKITLSQLDHLLATE
jgi:KDO transferase-3